ncbi:hypothetical protein AKJ50_00065 [candidate division MSBL1 archaeon SCGC-AAA382A13]|uniref:Uncharacterized protein n=2 Tax=candidate division MSBL1 TaxID=215777 RepID=A0A133VEG1_9EURY|nr:hypothetical protein AKJ49_01690 [candidate division MSBL1 archaeon SCGC-AAA382A03]KXB05728.1 hypothetical protein AKJ50_00065 [candidate division MSBL1 archaeon SCGC-AAA382A13]
MSNEQGKDYKAVLEDISDTGDIPPYLQDQNNSPFPMTEDQLSEEIQKINSFYETYGHYYDSNGPFVLTDYDPQNMVINMKRFTNIMEDTNYPFEADYWSKKLKRIKLTLGSLDIPTTIQIGDSIDLTITAEITQEYPEETSDPARVKCRTLQISHPVADSIQDAPTQKKFAKKKTPNSKKSKEEK